MPRNKDHGSFKWASPEVFAPMNALHTYPMVWMVEVRFEPGRQLRTTTVVHGVVLSFCGSSQEIPVPCPPLLSQACGSWTLWHILSRPKCVDPGLYCTYWWMLKLIWNFFKIICTRVQFCFPCTKTEACHSFEFRAPYLRDWQPFQFPIASVEISLVIKDGGRVWGRCLHQ